MTYLKYYIYDLINSKSKEKAVRNAENKLYLQRCSDVKKWNESSTLKINSVFSEYCNVASISTPIRLR